MLKQMTAAQIFQLGEWIRKNKSRIQEIQLLRDVVALATNELGFKVTPERVKELCRTVGVNVPNRTASSASNLQAINNRVEKNTKAIIDICKLLIALNKAPVNDEECMKLSWVIRDFLTSEGEEE